MILTPSRRINNQGPGGQRPHFTSLTSNVTDHSCIICKERHPLYVCGQFKSLSRDRKLSVLRSNNLCLNCLGPGHFARNCRSSNRCQKCQRLHHTLLHQSQEAAVSLQQSVPSAKTFSLSGYLSIHTNSRPFSSLSLSPRDF